MTTPAPVIPSALFIAAQHLRAAPHNYTALTERDRLLDASEKIRRGTLVNGRDGLQEDPRGLDYVGGRGSPLNEVLAAIETFIAGEHLVDVRSDWATIRLDRRDGYLYREADSDKPTTGGPGIAQTEHALGQLTSILSTGGTGRRTRPTTDVSPAIRALLLLELQATSKRERLDPVVVRTGLRFLEEAGIPGAFGSQTSIVNRTERVARAVVTPRHSGTAFDDLALAAVLRAAARSTAPSAFLRAELGIESRGWVEVGERAMHKGLDLLVTFRNSETGQARLSFHGSARISALDAVVVAHRGVSVVDDSDVTLVGAGGASERNHTLPTVLTKDLATKHPDMPCLKTWASSKPGTKLTGADRAIIARDRMAESFAKATESSLQLAAAWALALTSFCPGFDAAAFVESDEKAMAEVLLDLCEENGITLGDDRAALTRLLVDDKRLAALPHGSAAHIAACYAVLAGKGTTTVVEGKTVTVRPSWDEAQRLQQAAGRWVACGWDRKAHKAARGETD